MESKALVVMNYRQLALVFEQMESVARDESVHISERQEARALHEELANLMGRDDSIEPSELQVTIQTEAQLAPVDAYERIISLTTRFTDMSDKNAVEVRIKSALEETACEPTKNGDTTKDITIPGGGDLNIDDVKSHRWVEDAFTNEDGSFHVYVSVNDDSGPSVYTTQRMNSVIDALRSIYPNFGKARRKRRSVRRKYREILKGIDRGDSVYLPSSSDELDFLSNKLEKKYVRSNHLIQRNGSKSGNRKINGSYAYDVTENEEDIKRSVQAMIKLINRKNRISMIIESIFIVFTVLSLSLAVFLGLTVGDTLITELGDLI